MKELIVILMTSVLVNNYVLARFLGICPFLGVSKKLNQAVGMGVAVTFVMLMATAITYPIQVFLLEKLNLELPEEITLSPGDQATIHSPMMVTAIPMIIGVCAIGCGKLKSRLT